jgi:CBS-domain-containing membrane protein
MNATVDTLYTRLSELRAADVMNRDVVTIESALTMGEAARRMANRGVTSAPVVDEQGRCVGMLSAADYLMREVASGGAGCGRLTDESEFVLRQRPGEALCVEREETRDVWSYMSPAVQAIRSETPLVEAAQIMCASHLHRLPVLDGGGRPIGVVSSLDLVSALMNAVDEHRQLNTRSG